MIVTETRIPLFNLVTSLSKALDLMCPLLVNHHMQVAYTALALAGEIGLSPAEKREVAVAGALHDIGAFSVADRVALLRFELEKPHEHARAGYYLLKMFGPFSKIAEMVQFHHVPWRNGRGATFQDHAVPMGSHMLCLADNVSVLLDKTQFALSQADDILDKILANSGKTYVPELVQAFQRLAAKEFFWLELASDSLEAILLRRVGVETLELDLKQLCDFARLLCRVVDFKSAFTATHSSGVAASAVALAAKVGFSPRECEVMRIAAFLHDLGKLAIPSEILEKAGRLNDDEYDIMRSHVYHTFRILDSIEGLDVVNAWGSMHQERLNGSGYPFHRTAHDLPLGSRIMAVADVFTALTEDRPYRKGMTKQHTLDTLNRMVAEGELDGAVVATLAAHFDEINAQRAQAQQAAVEEYRQFIQSIA